MKISGTDKSNQSRLMKLYAPLLISGFIILLMSCNTESIEPVKEVDLNRFMGEWYEIASLPTTFNKGCTCSKVEMELEKKSGYVKVINSCIKKEKQGAVLAKAYIKEHSGNAKWRMQLFWPFRSDYYILKLADDYSYALVGNPDYTLLQVLSREPVLQKELLDELILYSGVLGYNIDNIQITTQNCE